jgi:hypothetical protein
MGEPHQPDDVNDEASQYLEDLVRNHLRTVRYKDPRPALTHTDHLTRAFLLENLIVGLEQDRNIVLGRLLRAAVKVRRIAVSEEAAVVDEFLQRPIDCIMGVGATEGTAFLQTVLEDLIRRGELDGDELIEDNELDKDDELGSDASSQDDFAPTSPGITVSIGNDIIQVAFDNILSCFWTSLLDTACHACSRPFFDEPPIRTIAKAGEPQAESTVHGRIFNRHFFCLQEHSIFFVPVSHVWDDSIREANQHQVHNNAAAFKLINTLKALFEGAEDAYEAGVEFWRDYFSVRQWQIGLKESLLLRLPAIYHLADEILVHIADIPPSYVSLLLCSGNVLKA